MSNRTIEDLAIAWVRELERADGREPRDARGQSAVDIISSERHIEVKAFGGSARGEMLWLEEAQVREARQNPDFWLYVVDGLRNGDPDSYGIVRYSRDEAVALIERGRRRVHWETTLPAGDYDARVTRC